MRAARLATVAVVILATLLVASAPAATNASPVAGPKNLRGFLLRPNEPVTHMFSRTPAFAWSPVQGAMCYELELATSRTFYGNSVVWSNVSPGTRAGKFCRAVVTTAPAAAGPGEEGSEGTSADLVRTVVAPIKIPVVSVNLVLPWFTGKPYALYARVRAITSRGPTSWGKPFGFNMRWESLPVPMPSKPGLVRWSPVEGSTFYEVWYGGKGPTGFINKIVQTHTNVADQRDLYTFHLDEGWWRTVTWRVRAVRQVIGSLLNGLPAVSYGPWSPAYATTNPSWSSGKLVLGATVSDRTSTSWSPPHQLMPGVTFTGDQGLDGVSYRLFRAYAFTDKDCVNVVFRGSVVGSPAFAPRINGPLMLPVNQEELDKALFRVLPNDKTEKAKTFTADTFPLTANETISAERALLRVDLPDLDVGTTRYFWTVVPVAILVEPDSGEFQYWDVESPQDACESGRIATFGKESKPAITAGGSPYVSGLSPKGRLLAQAGRKPVVYSTPLVAWRPVVGAMEYEIQWSRKTYPWRTSGSANTFASSAVLNLPAGLWYYRVRGLNRAQIGTPAMTWSAPVALRVVRPTFQIAG
jgi:hypothetical protein